MAIQYILRGEEQIKKIKKKKNGAIKPNLYLAVGHFWLAGLAGTVLAWPENRKPTSPSPHTINHYRRLISLSAASEIKNNNRFMRATAGSPSKANAIVQSCLVFFFVATPTFGFYNSRIFCFEFIKWYFSLGWMGCLIKLMMIWFCGFRSAYKSSIVPCASWWIVWFRSVNVLGYANLIKGTINKLPRKNALSLCPKTIKNGIFQFLVSIRRPNFVVRKDNFLYGQIIYD